jgi:hypothetical protein
VSPTLRCTEDTSIQRGTWTSAPTVSTLPGCGPSIGRTRCGSMPGTWRT